MKGHATTRAGLSVLVASMLLALSGQPKQIVAAQGVPSRIALSDVEVGLDARATGGCVAPCGAHRIRILGDGSVEYTDLANAPGAVRRTALPADRLVSLVNEFLAARFFDARDEYRSMQMVQLNGSSLQLVESGAADVTAYTLSLRMGTLSKSVRLHWGYPRELARLRDLVEGIGGASARPNP